VIDEITGIRRIRKLYLQLLYRCNFECSFCFHGERLAHADAFTSEQAIDLLNLMQRQYGTEAVTLLGGEPFVYRHLPTVVQHAKQRLGMHVEICTNGYRIQRRLAEVAPSVDLLRVSLEGLGEVNDGLRRAGSYDEVLRTLEAARTLGVPTGATMTVNARNAHQVIDLARVVQEHGGRQLKLHALRPVGNAATHPELALISPQALADLRQQLRAARLDIEIIVDEDLSPGCSPTGARGEATTEIDRIESDPRGALTMSCKAVGRDAHAFWYDKAACVIVHRPSASDELALAIPDVVYAQV
jgi:MoaA/NifB/PqqE/SkfB family radical SAM enzyme